MTVVIPARNEEAWIDRCLDSVLRQSYRNLQVLVVDGASEDRTPDIVRARARTDERVELLRNPDALIPISLNLALAAARGRWLVRIDAHASVPADYVATAARHLASGRWGGVGGRKDGIGVTDAGKAIARAMASPFGVGNSNYHFAQEPQEAEHVPFGAYPVELARELGGWDERLAVNQDFEFDFRVRQSGHPLLLDPALTIEWECRQSIRELFSQYFRYGRGKAKVARLHPESLRLRHLASPALVLNLATVCAVMALGRPRLAAGLAGPYAAAVTAATICTARGAATAAERRLLPAAFVTMHVAWGAGFLRGALPALRWRPTRWQGGKVWPTNERESVQAGRRAELRRSRPQAVAGRTRSPL